MFAQICMMGNTSLAIPVGDGLALIREATIQVRAGRCGVGGWSPVDANGEMYQEPCWLMTSCIGSTVPKTAFVISLRFSTSPQHRSTMNPVQTHIRLPPGPRSLNTMPYHLGRGSKACDLTSESGRQAGGDPIN